MSEDKGRELLTIARDMLVSNRYREDFIEEVDEYLNPTPKWMPSKGNGYKHCRPHLLVEQNRRYREALEKIASIRLPLPTDPTFKEIAKQALEQEVE